MRDADQLVAAGHARLDEVDEPRADLGRQGDVRGGGERVVVGHRLRRRPGADHADVAGAAGRDRAPGGREDHLDDRDVVPLPGVAQHGRAGGVAGDDERLHAEGDQVVEALEGVLADLADRLGAVGLARGVADVEHRLVRQLVDDRARDGEPAEAGVEDADGCLDPAAPASVLHGRLGVAAHACNATEITGPRMAARSLSAMRSPLRATLATAVSVGLSRARRRAGPAGASPAPDARPAGRRDHPGRGDLGRRAEPRRDHPARARPAPRRSTG